ncbi:MAG: nuclear transport factor 2 family protein [Pseudomonadota bacterium]
MDTQAIAEAFTGLMKEGKFDEAQDRFWAEDIRSIEAAPGPHADVTGREAMAAKHAWWEENSTEHSTEIRGPIVNGDMFMVHFDMDVTMKDMGRMQMSETGLYTVKDGKIVEERFFYPLGEPE